jgi:hypothetical protein
MRRYMDQDAGFVKAAMPINGIAAPTATSPYNPLTHAHSCNFNLAEINITSYIT